MAERGGELLTLTEVSNRTSISMPTLQRYKKEYQDRLPTVGKGRRQRYPEESLAVFEQIKKENIARRGRPRKSGGGGGARKPGPGRPKKASAAKAPEPARTDLLTLTEISERTGISYPTLVRYVKLEGDRIPHEGEGRRRRYYPAAVEVFQEMRSQSGRGRKRKSSGAGPKAAPSTGSAAAAGDGKLGQRVRSLEKSQERLEKQIHDLVQQLKKPITITLQRGGR